MELAGSLGDLGTMLPLLIPLIVFNGINATVAFLLVGIFYAGAGLYYKIPIPVQPLKAMAVLAIAGGFSASLIAAAGLIMGLLMLGLGLTGLINPLTRIFSRPVIRGIQVTLGLLLLLKSAQLVIDSNFFINGNSFQAPISFNLIVAVIGILTIGFLLNNARFPAAVILIAFGLLTGLMFGVPEIKFGPQLTLPPLPTWSQFHVALLCLVIPQIPLTISNAVISTSDLSKKYFKREGSRVTPKALSASMGAANVGVGILGGIPVCHGSGGLVAHHYFGARTGGANLMIGGIFITLALIFGSSAAAILGLIPLPILGVMLAFVGVQMVRLIFDLKSWRDFSVVLTIVALTLLTNMAVGFMVGIVLFYLLRWCSHGTKSQG
jgi:SulP family sulfate permease